MQLLTIVEAYVNAALERAVVEPLEDGTFVAYAPDCTGMLAYGDDVHECAVVLYARLEDWVKVFLTRGYQLPVIGGIDLNTSASQILASYHRNGVSPPQSEYFENDEQLDAALERRRKRS